MDSKAAELNSEEATIRKYSRKDMDFKMVIAAEGDLVQFSKIASHFSSEQTDSKEMFKPDTRPNAVRRLYEEAGNEDKVEKVVHVNCESIL